MYLKLNEGFILVGHFLTCFILPTLQFSIQSPDTRQPYNELRKS